MAGAGSSRAAGQGAAIKFSGSVTTKSGNTTFHMMGRVRINGALISTEIPIGEVTLTYKGRFDVGKGGGRWQDLLGCTGKWEAIVKK